MATEAQLRKKVVDIALNWVGRTEGSAGHQEILDIYNTASPLPRGVKMLPSYAWCAATVSAVFIKAGLANIGFTECSCSRMIALYKAKGRWEESDNYAGVKIGDVVMYDWDDNGKGDCTGNPEHTGIVISVSSGTIKVVEGNYNGSPDRVAIRTLKQNGRYIRGFCLPDYASMATTEKTASPAIDAARSGPLKAYNKVWTTTAVTGLHLRTGAGTKKTSQGLMVKGTKVRCYGYYTKQSDGTVWLLVVVQNGKLKGTTGFCSMTHLRLF